MTRPITRREFLQLSATTLGVVGVVEVTGCALGQSSSTSGASSLASSAQSAESSASSSSSSADTLLASFVVMSDTHIDADKERNCEHLTKALTDIRSFQPTPDTIVILGDITDSGNEEQYELAKELCADAGYDFGKDFVLVMGNHDQLKEDFNPEKAGWDEQYQRFMSYAGTSKVYYDTVMNGLHFICMGPDQNESGNWVRFNFTDEQIEWVRGLLDEDAKQGRTSYVFCHEPMLNTLRNTEPGSWVDRNSLEDSDELFNVVKGRSNVLFFTGHSHQYPSTARPDPNGPLYINDGAVATGQKEQDARYSGAYTGAFGWLVSVYGDRVVFKARDFLESKWIDDLEHIYI